jgi:hypothetical protein
MQEFLVETTNGDMLIAAKSEEEALEIVERDGHTVRYYDGKPYVHVFTYVGSTDAKMS